MTKLSNYNPETHREPSFLTISINDLPEDAVEDCKECDPEPRINVSSGIVFCPSDTEAADILDDEGADWIDPGDDDHDTWKDRWLNP